MNLTFGVIARNEMPYLGICLEQIKSIIGRFPDEFRFSFVLVDSSSDDGSRECMLEFASRVERATVFQVSGETNASIARNTVLDNMTPGALLMLDGDVVPSADFLEDAIDIVRNEHAAVVVGGLEEIYYDQSGSRLSHVANRYSAAKTGRVRLFDGIFFLSESALRANFRFKDYMDLSEDRDFALRVSRDLTCLRIPASMGVHHTQAYLSRQRVGEYLSQVQPKWTGLLLRNFLGDMPACRELLIRERGAFFALALQLLVMAMLLSSAGFVALLPLLVDYMGFLLRGRSREYFYARILTPWMIVYGLLLFRPKAKQYSVSRLA